MKTLCAPLMIATLTMVSSSLYVNVHAAEFDAALVQALQTSNLLKAQVAEKDVWAARRSTAVRAYLPQVVFDYETGKAKTQRNHGAWLDGTASTGTFSVSQPIVNVAALQGMGGAKKRLEVGEEGVRAKTQQVLLEATEAFANVAEAQGFVRLHESDVERLKKHVTAEEERFTAGVNTRTDIQRAVSRLAEAEADLHRVQGRLQAAVAQYTKRMGSAPEGGVSLPPFPEKVPETLEEALARAKENNPDLAGATLEALAAKKDVSVRRAERLPTLNVLGSATRAEGIADANGINETQDRSVMLNLRVPLFMRGIEYSNTREAKKVALKAGYDEAAVQENLVEQVTASWARLQASEEALKALTQTVVAGDEMLKGMVAEFESGSRTGLDVLDAERDVLAAKVDLLSQRKEMLLEAYRLLALMDGISIKEAAGDNL